MATVSIITNTVFGNKRAVLAKINFSSSYSTGGESLTAAMLGLQNIDAIFESVGAAAAGTSAVSVRFDSVHNKIQAFGNGGGAAHTHTGAAHTHTAGAITDAGHVHVENTAGSYTQNANTASGTASSTGAATGSTTPGAGGSTTPAVSAGPWAEIASTTDLSLLTFTILALGA